MKNVLDKIGGSANDNKREGDLPTSTNGAIRATTRRSFSVGRFPYKSTSPVSSSPRSTYDGSGETVATPTPTNRSTSPFVGGPREECRDREVSTPIDDTDGTRFVSPKGAKPLVPTAQEGQVPVVDDAVDPRVRRRRISMSLSPSSLRAALKSASQKVGAGRATDRDTLDKCGEGETEARDVPGSGCSSSAAQTGAAAAAAAGVSSSQQQSQPMKAARRGTRVSISFNPSFLRASLGTARQAEVGNAADSGRAKSNCTRGKQPLRGIGSHDLRPTSNQPQSVEGTEAAGAAEAAAVAGRGEGGQLGNSPMLPSSSTAFVRRMSRSLSPSYLRKAVGLKSSQDDACGPNGSGDNPTTSATSPGQVRAKLPGVSEESGTPPTKQRSFHPAGAEARRQRGSMSLSPASVRAAMRAAITKGGTSRDGGEGANVVGKDNGDADLRREFGLQPTLSNPKQQATTSTTAESVSGVSLPGASSAPKQRRRPSFHRSASFSLGVSTASVLRLVSSSGSRKEPTLEKESDTTARATVSVTARTLVPEFGAHTRAPDSDEGRHVRRATHNRSAAAAAAREREPVASSSGGSTDDSNRRLSRRSMSVALVGRGSNILAGFSPPPSPSSTRGAGYAKSGSNSRSPGTGSGSGGGGGGGGGGFRQRLRQKAAGVGVGGGGGSSSERRRRTGSVSPPSSGRAAASSHARAISIGPDLLPLGSVGSWAGGGPGGVGGRRRVGGDKDGPKGLPSLLDAVPASEWPELSKGLQEREAEFTTAHGLGIFVGTWNVNGKKPDVHDPLWLHEWLCPEDAMEKTGTINDSSSVSAADAAPSEVKSADTSGIDVMSERAKGDGMEDVYAIGFQELVDLNAVNVAIDLRSQKRSVEWEERVLSSLNLAALQQANKRRRREALSSTPQESDAGRELEDALPVMAGTMTESFPDFLSDEDIVEVASIASGVESDTDASEEEYEREGLATDAGVAASAAAVTTPVPTRTPGGSNPAAPGEWATPRVAAQGPGQTGRSQTFAPGSSGNEWATFVPVAKEHLVGTWLAVFVRASLLEHVTDVRSGTVSAGVMGVMGNKGGVGIRLRLRDSSLCFVTCHLAAHRDNVKARNENYHKILREMVFAPLPSGEWRRPQQRQQQEQHQRRTSNLRGGGSASPLSGRRQSMSIRLTKSATKGAGPAAGEEATAGSGFAASRRRISSAIAAPSSLAGILSPRYRNASATSMPSSPSARATFSSSAMARSEARGGRVTARSLSPPTSPDHNKLRQTDGMQRPQQQRGGPAGSRGRESSPPRQDGKSASAKTRRGRSMSTSWSTTSLSSIMPSSSAPSTAVTDHPSPPPGAPVVPEHETTQPLRLALTITLVPPGKSAVATAAARRAPTADAAGAGPSRDSPGHNTADPWPSPSEDGSSWSRSAGGATLAAVNDATVSSAGTAVADGSARGGGPAAIDVVRGKAAALGADNVGQKEGGVGQMEEAGGRDRGGGVHEKGERAAREGRAVPSHSVSAAPLCTQGRCPELCESLVASANRGDIEAEALGRDGVEVNDLLGMADLERDARSDAFSELVAETDCVGDGEDGDENNASASDVLREQASGGGGPTQLLCVPDTRRRDTGEHLGIQDHDAVFWFGDLNYRIESSIDAQEVLGHAVSRRLRFLAANDQLNGTRGAGEAFEGFHEARIDFSPTYKYTAGTDDYDTRNDKKFRAPAWCDRILSWVRLGEVRDEINASSPRCTEEAKAGVVRQFSYRRSETPLISDHKPVSASFRVGCKQVDAGAYGKVFLELVEKVSRVKGDGQPQVDIIGDANAIDFGTIRYGVPRSRSTRIINNGTVPAIFTLHSSQHRVTRQQDNNLPGRHQGNDEAPPTSLEGGSRLAQPVVETGALGVGLLGLDSDMVASAAIEGKREKGLGTQDRSDCRISGQGGREGREAFCQQEKEVVRRPHVCREGEQEPTADEAAAGSAGQWYSFEPTHGVLSPGEELEIRFTVLVNSSVGRALASGRLINGLKDVLVLRVYQGCDRYISLGGKYAPSVYGSTLQAMAMGAATTRSTYPITTSGGGVPGKPVHTAIRGAVGQEALCERGEGTRAGPGASPHEATAGTVDGYITASLVDSERDVGGGKAKVSAEGTVRIPYPLWRMVDALLDEGRYDQAGLFVDQGVEQEVRGIREAVDTGARFPPHCGCSMVEALVTLLESLSISVVPESACSAISEAGGATTGVEEKANRLLGALSPLHRDVFAYLVSFFRLVLSRKAKNGVTAKRLILAQRSCLLPDARRPICEDNEAFPPQAGGGALDSGERGRIVCGELLSRAEGRGPSCYGVKGEQDTGECFGLVLYHVLIGNPKRELASDAQ